MPSGSLGAQPQLWLNVVLVGPNGEHLWESGHLDSNGDMCDLHSLDVSAGKVKRDAQLVNFQTKFLITNVKGTEREMYLPVNLDIDPLPFFRPAQSLIQFLTTRPLFEWKPTVFRLWIHERLGTRSLQASCSKKDGIDCLFD